MAQRKLWRLGRDNAEGLATVRSSRVSRAFHTSPMPPSPMAETIWYGPSFAPAEIGM
jgi:hypothetical protein